MSPPLQGVELLKQLHVLYVEDDVDTREQLARLLSRVFREVSVAVDGRDALDQLQAGSDADVVITDIQMPRLNGLQLAEEVKRSYPTMPVVVTSAFNDAEYLLAGIRIGVDGYILKPVDFQTLLQTVGRCVLSLVQKRQLDAQFRELSRFRDQAGAELTLLSELMPRLLQSSALARPDVRYLLQPCDRVAGDLVAAAEDPQGRLFLMLADSIGHGLPAALHLVPVSCMFYEWVAEGRDLARIVAGLNRVLRERAPVGRFVAAEIACIDLAQGTLEVWNGGVPPGMYCAPDGQPIAVFEPQDMPLGVNLPGFTPGIWRGPLCDRAELLFFSDGVTERRNEDGVFFGEDVARQLVCDNPGEGFAAVRAALEAFTASPAEDDVSLLGFVTCWPAQED